MKTKIVFLLSFLVIGIILFTGCSQSEDQSAKTVETYLQALVAQDGSKLGNLSCKEWEKKAMLEMDSFQAVTAALEGLVCEKSGTDGKDMLVVCKGKIVATYNDEKQEIDLSLRTYRVAQEAGEWRVCGYR